MKQQPVWDVLSLIPHFNALNPAHRVYWVYLLAALLLAVLAIQLREARPSRFNLQTVLAACFPKHVYLHPSARVDYAFFIVNGSLYLLLMAPATLGTSYLVTGLLLAFEGWANPRPALDPIPVLTPFLFTMAVVTAGDLALYLTHRLVHAVDVCWEFHKVHHSAEVLTPVSAYRFHPLNDMLDLIALGTFTGVVDGLFRHFYAPELSAMTVIHVNAVTFAFNVFGFHLRHSHVWLSFGPVLGRVFISPAAHQIHHSKAPEHQDKNFGVIFAIWDWMAGTLVLPKAPERLTYGLASGDEMEFRSLRALYFHPFQAAFHRLVGPRVV